MNCPSCAKSIDPGQNFCRECGVALTARRPSRVRVGGVILLGFIFAGLLTAMGGKMFEMRWLAYLGLVVMMTAAFVMAAFAFLRETRPRGRTMKQGDVPAFSTTVEKADTTNKLLPLGQEDYIDPVPSVIESTTSLLETPLKRSRS